MTKYMFDKVKKAPGFQTCFKTAYIPVSMIAELYDDPGACESPKQAVESWLLVSLLQSLGGMGALY